MKKIFFALLMTSLFVSCSKNEESSLTPSGTGTVTDCQGNSYNTVKIGDQWWMAENLRCTMYDTESERPGIAIPVTTRPSSQSTTNYGPYYVDVSDSITPYSGNLTPERRSKLGLLYTWAAVVGESSQSNAQNRTTDYPGVRQGICPNGWHVPTDNEWTVLINNSGGYKNAGTVMKTSDGWYKGNDYVAGVNSSGFSVLPGGYDTGTYVSAGGSTVNLPSTYGIGFDANFWSASANAWYRGFTCNSSEVKHFPIAKFNYLSVRCVKNNDE